MEAFWKWFTVPITNSVLSILQKTIITFWNAKMIRQIFSKVDQLNCNANYFRVTSIECCHWVYGFMSDSARWCKSSSHCHLHITWSMKSFQKVFYWKHWKYWTGSWESHQIAEKERGRTLILPYSLSVHVQSTLILAIQNSEKLIEDWKILNRTETRFPVVVRIKIHELNLIGRQKKNKKNFHWCFK